MADNLKKLISQRGRGLAKFRHILYRKQSTQRLARFAPHCMNEADSVNVLPIISIAKALGNLQCGANAKRASAHFAAFYDMVLTSIESFLSEPFAPLRDKIFYDN